jgi:hypothetical protein
VARFSITTCSLLAAVWSTARTEAHPSTSTPQRGRPRERLLVDAPCGVVVNLHIANGHLPNFTACHMPGVDPFMADFVDSTLHASDLTGAAMRHSDFSPCRVRPDPPGRRGSDGPQDHREPGAIGRDARQPHDTQGEQTYLAAQATSASRARGVGATQTSPVRSVRLAPRGCASPTPATGGERAAMANGEIWTATNVHEPPRIRLGKSRMRRRPILETRIW